MPPPKKTKATTGDAAILLNLQPAQVVKDAGGSQHVHEELLEFAEKLKTAVLAAQASSSLEKTASSCSNCGNSDQLSKCSCYFEKDSYVVSGVILCKSCQEQQLLDESGFVIICHLCQQLLCRNGCNPLDCGDCSNAMCNHHDFGDCFKKCMCGKKLWCRSCSKSIDAQVKSGITTECDNCQRVSCGNSDCTIYKSCRMCYKRLCGNCVYRTNCDCDETLPLCEKCLVKYVCPNPDCAGEATTLLLSEFYE